MEYIKLVNGNPVRYSLGQLRRDNPKVSFPAEFPEKILAEYGVYKVTKEEPTFNKDTQKIDSWNYVKVAKNWILRATVSDLNEEEKRAKKKDKAKREIQDSFFNVPSMAVELIDVLVARGVISRSDFSAKTLKTYDAIKLASQTINS